MNPETTVPEETLHIEIDSQPKQTKKEQMSLQEIVDILKSAEDDIGQINESSSEEQNLVREFLESLGKLMQLFATSMPISPSTLPEEFGKVMSANIDATGHLALQLQDGRFELKDLSEEKNRDLLIQVIQDIIPKFKQLTSAQRRKVENRIKFLSSVTKETQKISKALSSVDSEEPQK